ncbi:MAG: hypothetical protein AAF985_10560 [Bacteroidota bacterium]
MGYSLGALKFASVLLRIFWVVGLTLLTQIGGLLYLCYFFGLRKWLRARYGELALWKRGLAFGSFYALVSLLLIPLIASQLGRVPIPLFSSPQQAIQPASILTCLSNRHYVRPQLKQLALEVSREVRKQIPDFRMVYLDANFPFWNGFPLLPHRSHDDGEKLDIAFIYHDSDGRLTNATPSILGYGICEEPRQGERDQAAICARKGYWQYSLLQQMTFGWWREKYIFDKDKTRILLETLARRKEMGKIFIEPHLVQRLKLQQYPKIRFHGCPAVRHDDHIHFQL